MNFIYKIIAWLGQIINLFAHIVVTNFEGVKKLTNMGRVR